MAKEKAAEKTTSAILFEKWNAKPVYKFSLNEETGEKEKTLVRVDKVGDKPLATTSIEQRHADTLNGQVENSGVYYFTAKTTTDEKK